MDVIPKLSKIPLAVKIVLAVVVAIVLGIASYLVLGPGAGAATGVGGAVVSFLGLFRSGSRGETATLLNEKLERTKRDGDAEIAESELAARERADARARDAADMARAAGADDGDDVNRVYERDTRPSGDD